MACPGAALLGCPHPPTMTMTSSSKSALVQMMMALRLKAWYLQGAEQDAGRSAGHSWAKTTQLCHSLCQVAIAFQLIIVYLSQLFLSRPTCQLR